MSKAIVGALAPFFKSKAWCPVSNSVKTLSLTDYKDRYLLLFFYPLDFTFVCPTEIVEFSNQSNKFKDLGCDVVGCSVDSVHSHRVFSSTPKDQGGLGQLNIPLLSDITHQISTDYGVLIPSAGISLRGTFLIDRAQTLRHASINDLPVGRNVDEYLRLLKAFQFVEKHGEDVCPANWTPESNATINVAKPNLYWSKVHSQK